MTTKYTTDELTIQDLKDASGALEGWLDAFGDDPDCDDWAVGVRRVKAKLDRIIEMERQKPGLRLVTTPPEDVH